MEQQAKQGVDRQAAAQTFQIADQLMKTGVGVQSQTAGIYSELLRAQMQKDQEFQRALQSFASGLASAGTSFSGIG
jgi:hypothetical protein